MSADTTNLSLVKDEEVLRKMWQDTEDFGKKKEIRSHMYKLREQRLKEFYNSGEITETKMTKSSGKVTQSSTHADSLVDQSFMSLKSKEVRDSESPTRELHYKVPDNNEWQIATNNEISRDGKTKISQTLAAVQGSQKIPDGQVDFKARTEQTSSVYEDANTKAVANKFQASESSTTHVVSSKELPINLQGVTKVTKETKTLPDGSTVTTTRYDTKSGASQTSVQSASQTSSRNVNQNYSTSELKQIELPTTVTTTITREIPDNSQISTNKYHSTNDTVQNSSYQTSREKESLYTSNDSPNNLQGVTKVTRETKTLPDGSIVTTTRYDTTGATSHSELKANVKVSKDHSSSTRHSEQEIVKEYGSVIDNQQNYVDNRNRINQIDQSNEIRRTNDERKLQSTSKVTKEHHTKENQICIDQTDGDKTSYVTSSNKQPVDFINHETVKNVTNIKNITEKSNTDNFVNIERQQEQVTRDKNINDKPTRGRSPTKIPKSEYEPSKATVGQYDTTYKTDYTNRKISVEVSPTHDAFARSLRSVSPDRITSRGSHRTSNSSLPEKMRHPSRYSPERYQKSPSPKRTTSSDTFKRTSSNETITISTTSKIDSSVKKNVYNKSRSPSPKKTRDYLRRSGDIITDLDDDVTVTTTTIKESITTGTRPTSLEFTKKSRKISDRSPSSPLSPNKSPSKEIRRSSSFKSPIKGKSPQFEEPKHLKSPSSKNLPEDRPLKRTDTYEERCRQILGITEVNDKRRSSLERSSSKRNSFRRNVSSSNIDNTVKTIESITKNEKEPAKVKPSSRPTSKDFSNDVTLDMIITQKYVPDSKPTEKSPEFTTKGKSPTRYSQTTVTDEKITTQRPVVTSYPITPSRGKSPTKQKTHELATTEFITQEKKSTTENVTNNVPYQKRSPSKETIKIRTDKTVSIEDLNIIDRKEDFTEKYTTKIGSIDEKSPKKPLTEFPSQSKLPAKKRPEIITNEFITNEKIATYTEDTLKSDVTKVSNVEKNTEFPYQKRTPSKESLKTKKDKDQSFEETITTEFVTKTVQPTKKPSSPSKSPTRLQYVGDKITTDKCITQVTDEDIERYDVTTVSKTKEDKPTSKKPGIAEFPSQKRYPSKETLTTKKDKEEIITNEFVTKTVIKDEKPIKKSSSPSKSPTRPDTSQSIRDKITTDKYITQVTDKVTSNTERYDVTTVSKTKEDKTTPKKPEIAEFPSQKRYPSKESLKTKKDKEEIITNEFVTKTVVRNEQPTKKPSLPSKSPNRSSIIDTPQYIRDKITTDSTQVTDEVIERYDVTTVSKTKEDKPTPKRPEIAEFPSQKRFPSKEETNTNECITKTVIKNEQTTKQPSSPSKSPTRPNLIDTPQYIRDKITTDKCNTQVTDDVIETYDVTTVSKTKEDKPTSKRPEIAEFPSQKRFPSKEQTNTNEFVTKTVIKNEQTTKKPSSPSKSPTRPNIIDTPQYITQVTDDVIETYDVTAVSKTKEDKPTSKRPEIAEFPSQKRFPSKESLKTNKDKEETVTNVSVTKTVFRNEQPTKKPSSPSRSPTRPIGTSQSTTDKCIIQVTDEVISNIQRYDTTTVSNHTKDKPTQKRPEIAEFPSQKRFPSKESIKTKKNTVSVEDIDITDNVSFEETVTVGKITNDKVTSNIQKTTKKSDIPNVLKTKEDKPVTKRPEIPSQKKSPSYKTRTENISVEAVTTKTNEKPIKRIEFTSQIKFPTKDIEYETAPLSKTKEQPKKKGPSEYPAVQNKVITTQEYINENNLDINDIIDDIIITENLNKPTKKAPITEYPSQLKPTKKTEDDTTEIVVTDEFEISITNWNKKPVTEFPSQIRKDKEKKQIVTKGKITPKVKPSSKEPTATVKNIQPISYEGRVPVEEPICIKRHIHNECPEDEHNKHHIVKKVLPNSTTPRRLYKQYSVDKPETRKPLNGVTEYTDQYSKNKLTPKTIFKPSNKINKPSIKKIVTKYDKTEEPTHKQPITETITKKTSRTILKENEIPKRRPIDTVTGITPAKSAKPKTEQVGKTHLVTTTITLKNGHQPVTNKQKPTVKVTEKKVMISKQQKNLEISTETDEESVIEEMTDITKKTVTKPDKKCITTKTVTINNNNNNQAVDLQRSTSSREPTPDSVYAVPLTTGNEEYQSPRYPDEIVEPEEDNIRSKPKRLSDIPLVEYEDTTNFSRITEIVDSHVITERDKVEHTDESLLSVNRKIDLFTDTADKLTKDTKKSSGPAPKVDRPKLHVTKDLESDECLLSVSQKVNKFVNTAEQFIDLAERPKSPRCRFINDKVVSDTDNTTKISLENINIDTKKVIERKPSHPYNTITKRISLENLDTRTYRSKSPESKSPTRAYTPTKERGDSPVSRRSSSLTRTPETPDRRPSNEYASIKSLNTQEKSIRRDSSPELIDTTPKTKKTKPIEDKRTILSSTGRLRSTESIKKARELFENISKDQERSSKSPILDRKVVRKLSYSSEDDRSSKFDRSRSTSPGKHAVSPYENGDIPHYMLPLDRSIRPHSPHKENVTSIPNEPKTSKFGVTLRKTPHTGEPTNITYIERNFGNLDELTEEIIQDIYEIEILEELLQKVTSYEIRRIIRTQIRLVKKLISENRLTTYIHEQNQLKTKKDFITEKLEYSSTYTSNIRRKSSSEIITEESRKSPVRQTSPIRKLSTDDTTIRSTYIVKSSHPHKKPEEVRNKSPERTTVLTTKTVRPLSPIRKLHPEEKINRNTYTARRDSDEVRKPNTEKVSIEQIRKTSTDRTIYTTTQKTTTRDSRTSPERSPTRKLEPKRPSPNTNTTYSVLKKTELNKKKIEDSKPEWITQRNLKKVTPSSESNKIRNTSSKTVVKKEKLVSSSSGTCQPTDLITSSYGVGPTDENGTPLFGLKALRTQNNNNSTKVQGTFIKSEYYSENGHEPVGQISVTKYSTDPRDLSTDEQIENNNLVTSVTTTQKFGYEDAPSLEALKSKRVDTQIEDSVLSGARTSTFKRKNSVKALSQKFIDSTVESLKNEKQTSYPKAGLILRTSSFKDSKNGGHNEENTSTDILTSTKTTKHTTTTKTTAGGSFLSNKSTISGVQDVITRMKTEEYQEGENSEDTEARNLLNKFIGSQVLLTGMENHSTSSSSLKSSKTTEVVPSSGSSTRKTIKITRTFTEGGKTKTQTLVFQSPVTEEELDNIWDEQTLRLLLEQSTEYGERRVIRNRLKIVMAEQEACAELVEKASQEQSSGKIEETVSVEKSTSESPVATKTQVTKVTTQQQITKKPLSPFAKFRQLDKQNSINTPPSTPGSPKTPGGGPLFKFTDPAVSQSASTIKERLLFWCRVKTKEYENVQLDNFSSSWADGLAFCALIHHFLPDAFDYHVLTPKDRRHNFELAFSVASEKADIFPLLDVEDMMALQRPDWKCVFTYVQSIYRRFKNEEI